MAKVAASRLIGQTLAISRGRCIDCRGSGTFQNDMLQLAEDGIARIVPANVLSRKGFMPADLARHGRHCINDSGEHATRHAAKHGGSEQNRLLGPGH